MISLKKVSSEDAKFLFDLANDVEVRKNSFNEEKIEYGKHMSWLNEKLKDENIKFYTIRINNERIGQIRLENKVLSYSIEKSYRGLGYGTLALEKIKEESNEEILGYVKKTNIGSIKAFEKARYIRVEEEADFILFKYTKNTFK